MMDRFEEEMIEKVERAIVENLPEQRSKERFIEKRYDTIAQILACFEKNKDLLQFLLKANYSSFQAKFRNKIKRIASEMALPAIGKLRYEISADLFAFIFTSILLSLAEYAFQSKTSIDIKRSAEFNIVLLGPAKTLGTLGIIQPAHKLEQAVKSGKRSNRNSKKQNRSSKRPAKNYS